MANIKNTEEWVENVRQIEVGDRVIGGADGPINISLSHLVGRTGYLKKKLEEHKPEAASTTHAGIVQLSSATNSDSEELAATPKAVKAAYDKAVESAGKGIPVGAVVAFPRAVSNLEGYLKCDGTTFNQATYPDLYAALSNSNRLPDLTRSDVGMTAYFPVDDIPAGWLKYDDIAARVNQSDYPELYRKLVAQYGSISAVPKAEDRFLRGASGGLTVGQVQADEIKKHVHRHIENNTAGAGNYNDKTFDFSSRDGTDRNLLNISTAGGDGNGDNWWITPNPNSRFATGGEETRPKALVMMLCIKAKNSLDDVVFWIKAFGKVTNAGALDASTLAAGLQDKADKTELARVEQKIPDQRPLEQKIREVEAQIKPAAVLRLITESQTLTVPEGITLIYVTLIGGGGGHGGQKHYNWDDGKNGEAKRGYIQVESGQQLEITVGAGGNAGWENSNGGSGGDTKIRRDGQDLLVAPGGGGGLSGWGQGKSATYTYEAVIIGTQYGRGSGRNKSGNGEPGACIIEGI